MGITSGQGRVSQPEYWLYFGCYVLISIGSLVSIFYFAAQLRFAIALFAAMILMVSGLGFRVIEMWRCRDIGWPGSLPWLLFGSQFFLSIFAGITGMSLTAMIVLSIVLSVVDFGFAIVIGCLPTQRVQQVDVNTYKPIDYSGFKRNDGSAAVSDLNEIGRARLEQAQAQAQAPRPVATIVKPASVAPQPQPVGFGRKGL